MDEEVRTTLAFVHTLADGDREFSFYRNPGADMMLSEEEINPEVIKGTKIFHFGTLSMTHQGVRNATKKQFPLRKRQVQSFLLIRICESLCGSLWSLQKSRWNMVSGNAIF